MNKLVNYLTKESLNNHGSISAKKNQTIFFEGDECHKVGIILSGKVSIISYFDEGKEVIYNTLGKGEMFGSNLIFSSSPYYRGDVVAIEESEIVYINKEELLSLLKNDTSILELYLKQQSDFSKRLNFKIKLLTIDSAKERIKYYLTFNKNEIEYKSITKLAKELYLSRETTSRTLYKMDKDGDIKIANKKIILKQ